MGIIGKWPWLCVFWARGEFGIWLAGRAWILKRRTALMFSERYGYTPVKKMPFCWYLVTKTLSRPTTIED